MAKASNMTTIQSRNNGLIIAIPPMARGLLSRFATKGENELVFVKPKGVRPADAKDGENFKKPVVIESTTLDGNSKPTDLA